MNYKVKNYIKQEFRLMKRHFDNFTVQTWGLVGIMGVLFISMIIIVLIKMVR